MERLSRHTLAALFVVVTMLAGACASSSGRPSSSIDEEEMAARFKQADAYYRNHFYARALTEFQAIYDADPEGDFADNALYKIAGIHLKQEQPEKAVVYFQQLQASFPNSPYAEESIYNMGFCYFQMGETKRALETYELYLTRSSARNKNRARVLAAQALSELGRHDEALRYYATASRDERDRNKQIEILQGAKVLIDDHLDTRDLLLRMGDLNAGPVADYVRYRAGKDLLSVREEGQARTVLSGIDFSRSNFQFYQEAQRELDRLAGVKAAPVVASAAPARSKPIQARTAAEDEGDNTPAPEAKSGDGDIPDVPDGGLYDPMADAGLMDDGPVAEGPALHVGVILPLSGRFEVYGTQVLDGIMLAVETSGEQGVPIRVVIRDSEGDENIAASMVEELAADPAIVAIVGPLLVKEADLAAQKADELGMPMLTLSRMEGLVEDKPFVFRAGITFDHQTRALVRYADTHLGATTFAVMHPDNEFGYAFLASLERALDPSRQQMVAAASYPTDETDFRGPIFKIKGADPDAIFIPDSADRVALIAPQLVYFGVKDVELLGPTSWNQPELAEKAGAYLGRAVIVDSFFAESNDPTVRNFTGRFQDMFGREPSRLSAMGFDAVGLIGDAAGSASDTRGALRRSLALIRSHHGATGETSLRGDGEVDKSLFLLGVQDGRIQEKY
ncbi:MAG: penicillin-binding protein activator [Deltaproteobacteria bacterium]|nr:penicillin-binding protein activator [Deltaproteobacteria bacterium]